MDYEVGLRPEYVETLEQARHSLLSYATLVLPAFTVWGIGLLAFFRWRESRILLLLAAYFLGVLLFWPLAVAEIYAIQSVKEANMQTDAEMADFASDTGVVFAPILQPIVGGVYCGLHLAGVVAIGAIASFFSGTKRNAAEFMQ